MNIPKGILHAIKKLKIMKKYMVILPLSAVTVFVSLPKGADAQVIIGQVLGETVGRVIRAIDLQVQRMQNQTIWLQNAQKALENQLSKLKLTEISDWSQKQKDLYDGYYKELWQVKSIIAYYERIKDITTKQAALVSQYNNAWNLLKQDKHFNAEELTYMQSVYSGILQESVKNLDEILVVINSFKTQMSDAKRLELIDKAADRVDTNCSDLKQFNNQNYLLSIQRARDENEVSTLKRYYGID
ncbi:conjugal transfer protein TraI [Mucilaginibacter rubeus]|uniref:Conjugal transfer protein TraI n=2 Tax=Mucilaginibacter rubeus TaxID=2027860 RepID=A0ABX7U6W9_9SPHI|nr:conjugal transfer protein TraI [Mucilaginibacter rubeus]QTE48164.1 conjugal transfer protein TraI [Mucilaginibacter rubeus]QTE59555.1 conjugal transfer protein TraI [Mucilaginibacter rubeus]QTE60985.1 conjugal transfer protein TraI [Mucilaginibacter rubeus]QTF59746.1 conjugal transfer protein TraI [Mucilaginibacter rubeus]